MGYKTDYVSYEFNTFMGYGGIRYMKGLKTMYMFKYILKRLGLMLFTFSVIMFVCFVLIKSLPIPLNDGLGKDKELLEANLRARGYYDPIMVQLWHYLERIFTKGDFGIGTTMSGFVNKPVWDSFAEIW